MKFFPVILLASMACASSVFAYSKEQDEAEERHAAVSQAASPSDPSQSSENLVASELLRAPKRDASPEAVSLEDVFSRQKSSDSEAQEVQSMRSPQQNNEIVEHEETASEQSETAIKNSQQEGRLANLGLKYGTKVDQILTRLSNKMRKLLP